MELIYGKGVIMVYENDLQKRRKHHLKMLESGMVSVQSMKAIFKTIPRNFIAMQFNARDWDDIYEKYTVPQISAGLKKVLTKCIQEWT